MVMLISLTIVPNPRGKTVDVRSTPPLEDFFSSQNERKGHIVKVLEGMLLKLGQNNL